jgi:DNA-binding CsgD family transcriptional regulator
MLAGDELRAADGRPRSPWLTGAAALTTSELRVARLAASGLSNRQIAEALFVTVKTVEMHLTHLYRKLGSSSRNDLPRLLETELEGDQARQPKTKTAKTQNPKPP